MVPTKKRPKKKAADAPNGARCPVESYARAVVAGEVVAGRLVRLACERHLRDLEHGHERGLTWDPAAAERVFEFASFAKLPGGKPFVLQPFQQFILGSLFGWKGPDGFRRFRTGFVEMGKGNGKSPIAALVGLYGLIADSEPAAEIYAAATKKDQAMVLFRHAVSIVDASPQLSKIIKKSGAFPNVWNLAYASKSAFFRCIASDDAQSGPKVHVGLLDEIHEHKSPNVVDMMQAGTKGRDQALIFEITNSGFDRMSICWDHHDYSVKVLEGSLGNDQWFAYVCTLDPCAECQAAGKRQPTSGCVKCDQWTGESVWPKANPGLGTILPIKYIRERVALAQGMPSKLNIVLRLNFCVWTEGEATAIPSDRWAACSKVKDPVAWRDEMFRALRGRTCFGGLDLGNTGDLTSLVLLFPPDGNLQWIALPWFWMPEIAARARVERERIPYDLWIRQGFIIQTPGNVTDYDFVRKDINEAASIFSIRDIAVDRTFNGAQLVHS
jgi:phage terminase large subunit-like protein